MSEKFDTDYLEVGDTFVGGPIEQSYFIGAVMAAGGEVDIHGDTVYIVQLPKKAKAPVSEKPVEKAPEPVQETKVEEPKAEESKVEEPKVETPKDVDPEVAIAPEPKAETPKVEAPKPAVKTGFKPKYTPASEAKDGE